MTSQPPKAAAGDSDTAATPAPAPAATPAPAPAPETAFGQLQAKVLQYLAPSDEILNLGLGKCVCAARAHTDRVCR